VSVGQATNPNSGVALKKRASGIWLRVLFLRRCPPKVSDVNRSKHRLRSSRSSVDRMPRFSSAPRLLRYGNAREDQTADLLLGNSPQKTRHGSQAEGVWISNVQRCGRCGQVCPAGVPGAARARTILAAVGVPGERSLMLREQFIPDVA
jgi:hypothetical protein